jgi:deoxyadenosine/deoxycytidine kinase
MIIALDGNVFVGKTTLCNILSKNNNNNVILEYSDFVNKFKNKLSQEFSFLEHSEYLNIDDSRKKYLIKGINFLDRSFVSLSAHTYAIYKNGIADFRKKHINLFNKLLNNNSIIIPDYYIFVTCDYACAKKRFLLEQITHGKKGTPQFFIDKDYFLAINEFNELWQKNIENGLFIDTSHTNKKNNLVDIDKNFNKKLTKKQIVSITKSIFWEVKI